MSSCRSNRKVYALTDPGLAELRDWMLSPGKPMPFKDDLLVKLYAGTAVEPAALLAELAHHQALHGDRLAQYEQIESSHFPRPEALPPQARLIWLTLQAGLSYERSWLEWSELARRTLGALLPGTD